jgi:hypothetical protein
VFRCDDGACLKTRSLLVVVGCQQLPFRTNNYVIEELIDWNNVPADPIFQLTFPQPGMLPAEWLEEVHSVRMNG